MTVATSALLAFSGILGRAPCGHRRIVLFGPRVGLIIFKMFLFVSEKLIASVSVCSVSNKYAHVTHCLACLYLAVIWLLSKKAGCIVVASFESYCIIFGSLICSS